jgi:hypothetical protein
MSDQVQADQQVEASADQVERLPLSPGVGKAASVAGAPKQGQSSANQGKPKPAKKKPVSAPAEPRQAASRQPVASSPVASSPVASAPGGLTERSTVEMLLSQNALLMAQLQQSQETILTLVGNVASAASRPQPLPSDGGRKRKGKDEDLGEKQLLRILKGPYFFGGEMRVSARKGDIITYFPKRHRVLINGKIFDKITPFLDVLRMQEEGKLRRFEIVSEEEQAKVGSGYLRAGQGPTTPQAPEPMIDLDKPMTLRDLLGIGGKERFVPASMVRAASGSVMQRVGGVAQTAVELPPPGQRKHLIAKMDGTKMDQKQSGQVQERSDRVLPVQRQNMVEVGRILDTNGNFAEPADQAKAEKAQRA